MPRVKQVFIKSIATIDSPKRVNEPDFVGIAQYATNKYRTRSITDNVVYISTLHYNLQTVQKLCYLGQFGFDRDIQHSTESALDIWYLCRERGHSRQMASLQNPVTP